MYKISLKLYIEVKTYEFTLNFMNIAKFSLSTILLSCLVGCGGGSNGDDASSTFNVSSANGVKQATNTSAQQPNSLPVGTIISINPEITLDQELNSTSTPASALYQNSSSSSDFPEGSQFIYVSMEEIGDSVKLSFEVLEQTVELTLTNFLDIGGTGYTDEFSVQAEVKDKNGEVTKSTGTGSFRGNKPRNNNVPEPINVNRAPAVDEFYQYIVGRPIYYEFESSGQSVESGLSTENVYLVLNPNMTVSGTVFRSSSTTPKWEHSYSNGNHILRLKTINQIEGNDWDVTVTYLLNFTTFTEGTWEIIETLAEYEYGSNSESIKQTTDGYIAKGSWRIYSKLN